MMIYLRKNFSIYLRKRRPGVGSGNSFSDLLYRMFMNEARAIFMLNVSDPVRTNFCYRLKNTEPRN